MAQYPQIHLFILYNFKNIFTNNKKEKGKKSHVEDDFNYKSDDFLVQLKISCYLMSKYSKKYIKRKAVTGKQIFQEKILQVKKIQKI